MKILQFTVFALLSCSTVFAQQKPKREVINLNGTWQIEEGNREKIPARFNHTVAVPGLVTLASPQFKNVGPVVKSYRKNVPEVDSLREAFWYKRSFTVNGKIPAIALLKVHKAMFGAKVFLNGKLVGEHLPCFTPGYFNVKRALKEGTNEVVIRIGSHRGSVPESIRTGFDFEKVRYIPGIFDNVEILLSGTPHVLQVQAAPNIRTNNLRVQVKLGNVGAQKSSNVSFTITEAKSKKVVGNLVKQVALNPSGDNELVDVSIPIADCKLWSPEDPFLYNLQVSTEADEYNCRVGMREFYLDTLTKKAVLNGKPYFMRGSNITLYRFFEDPACGNLPWDASWVRNMHKGFKKFHLNSLRYCIGFPSEEWYNIADEEGFLIQDEFPIWYGGKTWSQWPKELKAPLLAKEYTEWMQERWNHPCVVVWDASNETYSPTEELAAAIKLVRHLDLSKRPWDNGYSAIREPGDFYESHPYHFQDEKFKLKDVPGTSRAPFGNDIPNFNTGKYPVIINEYGWLWLNRDGSPTTLTKKLYANLLGENATPQQRRHIYAMYAAAETEYWRNYRQVAAVLHFTALGYSRPDGQTSDHFTNPATLEYEAEFLKYMPDAFAPVGLMLDEWGAEIATNKAHDFRVVTINDLETDWRGKVRIRISKDNNVVSEQTSDLYIPLHGTSTVTLSCKTPNVAGVYVVEAILEKPGEAGVKSTREIPFK